MESARCEFVEKLRYKRDEIIRHTLRHEGLLQLATEGKAEGEGCRGRPGINE